MAIVLDLPASTNLENWTGLRNSIEAWLDRTDLNDRIPDFIRLAEARFRREITRVERETTIPLPGSLPADFDSVREIFLPDCPSAALVQVGLPELRERFSGQGMPRVYAIVAGQIVVGPTPISAVTALLTYNAKIPALSATNQINWLLADHPDLYLYGALLHAEMFGWNDERLPLMKAAVDETLAEINRAGLRRKHGSGPLTMRSGVMQVRGGRS
ncbi:MAG: hypothetical protein ABS87_01005 [Sphingomonas sp. SCN 67-18]|nr:hypothetical protein [Sphingomonas sp. SCN 67-18]ODU22777.1 MAG: hypothetical protein ABS87_01005 [Sphingomonas sp. SCN 67-18]